MSQRTKHVDIRYRFVQEFVLDGFIKVIFVRTNNNDSDIFTKNLELDLHEHHSKNMIIEKGNRKMTTIQRGRVLQDVDCCRNSGS